MVKEIKLNKIQIESIKEAFSDVLNFDIMESFHFDESDGVLYFSDTGSFSNLVHMQVSKYKTMICSLSDTNVYDKKREDIYKMIIKHLEEIGKKAFQL